ncbi:MAG: type II toxin-antitoxin system PemK/MazF family toxin [bacterium]|nr:type II toxin-antitoxin system PemK/MazF family toxin [bacterium]
MKKDFDSWNKKKKHIDAQLEYLPLYHEREIRWCRLGVNIGFEQDGTGTDYSRPVLIMKGFSRQVCLIVPLTTSTKKNRYYVSVGDVDGKKAAAIISQLRLIDTKRLDQRIATLNQETFEVIRKAVKGLL